MQGCTPPSRALIALGGTVAGGLGGPWLTGVDQTKIDAVALYRDLATSQDEIALRLGVGNPITRAYGWDANTWQRSAT
jgi:hypothetical protein